MTDSELCEALRDAVRKQALQVYYQPIVSLRDGRITGFEALARWWHEGHCIPPSRFIRLAERNALIADLDDLVLRRACRQLRLWREAELIGPDHFVSINLCTRELRDPDLTERIRTILRDNALPGPSLHLEIAPGEAPLDAMDMAALITLRALGVGCSLSFAGGHGELAADLSDLPVDLLKIRQRDENQLRFFIDRAHDQGIKVVAEAVEDERLLRRLLNLHCEFAQGYYFSPPVDAVQAGRILAGDPRWRRVLH